MRKIKFDAMSVVLALVALAFAMCSCGVNSAAAGSEKQPNKRLMLVYSSGETDIYQDMNTGVQYLVFDGYNQGGICPLYNADGTLYVGD